MGTNKYYLPLDAKNLAHYFVKACLCPTNYINARNEDIQNSFPNYILLSNEKFVQNSDCSIEIVLNNNDEVPIKISKNFYLFEKPLPITRIKKVFLKSEALKQQLLFNINDGAAFLPEKLIEVDASKESINTWQIKNVKNESNNEWNEKLDLFNRILGGFAVMSISGIENTFPVDYFNTLSTFNKLIKESLLDQSVYTNKNYDWALIKSDKFTELFEAIHSKIDNSTINYFASKEKIALIKNNGKIVIDKIKKESNTYNIATLGSYGEGTRMTIDSFISDLVSDKFPSEKKEGLSLMFGINQGYEAFRNKYKTQNFEVDIKFKLNSQLDYCTIESIYQLVFNNKTDNYKFNYLVWCPEYTEKKNYKEYDTFHILDRTFIIKKKEEEVYSQSFQNLFQSTSKKDIYEKILAEYIKLLPPFIKITSNEEAVKYFSDIIDDNLKEFGNSFFIKGCKEGLDKELKSIEIKNNQIITKLEDTIEKQKNRIEELENNLIKDNFSFSNKNTDEVVTSKVNEPSNFIELEPTLIPIENENEYVFNKRKKELKALKITKLKEVAKSIGVKNGNDFKNERASMDELVEIVLSIEFRVN